MLPANKRSPRFGTKNCNRRNKLRLAREAKEKQSETATRPDQLMHGDGPSDTRASDSSVTVSVTDVQEANDRRDILHDLCVSCRLTVHRAMLSSSRHIAVNELTVIHLVMYHLS